MKISKFYLTPESIPKYAYTKIIKSGDSMEASTFTQINRHSHIKKIDKNTYKVKRTQEIRTYNHKTERKDTLRQTFANLRHTINANITPETVENVLWVTLTYAENMTDTKRLYNDFRKFIQRLRYYCMKNGLPDFEYITVIEPQARGAWHHHVLLIWNSPAPFIPNSTLAEIWGFGFTKVQSLKNKHSVTNIGRYLTAYLTDISLDSDDEIAEVLNNSSNHSYSIKNVKGKKYIKGARLHMYPQNMRIFRHSRGIKLPEVIRTSREKALKMLDEHDASLTYCSGYYLYDKDTGFSGKVCKEYYSISPTTQFRIRLVKASKRAKISRYFFNEFIELQSAVTEFIEYSEPPYKSLCFENT